MKYVVFILFLVVSFCNAQTKYDNFDALIKKANVFKAESDFKKAIENYEKALSILTPNSSTPFFDLASCAIQIESMDLPDTWIRKGVSVGGAPLSYLKSYSGFATIQDLDFYKKIIEDYNLLRQQYFTTIENIDLYLEIEELTARDQFVRKIDDYISGRTEEDMDLAMQGLMKAKKENDSVAEKKYRDLLFPKKNDEYKELQRELMLKVDDLNIQRLKEITLEHGWQERAWIILWHQRGNYGKDTEVWNFFKPIINKEIEEGKLSRSFWNIFDNFKERMENMKNTSSDSKSSIKVIKN